jgi:hypothetical protein
MDLSNTLKFANYFCSEIHAICIYRSVQISAKTHAKAVAKQGVGFSARPVAEDPGLDRASHLRCCPYRALSLPPVGRSDLIRIVRLVRTFFQTSRLPDTRPAPANLLNGLPQNVIGGERWFALDGEQRP